MNLNTENNIRQSIREMANQNRNIQIKETSLTNLSDQFDEEITIYCDCEIIDEDRFISYIIYHYESLNLEPHANDDYYAYYSAFNYALENSGNWINIDNAGLSRVNKYVNLF